jgi:hypothetical protein
MAITMKRKWLINVIVIATCGTPLTDALARPQLDRDLSGYAIASCMIASGDAVLSEQGEGWSGAIVQRSRGPIETFQVITSAVKAEIKISGFAVGHRDGPVNSGSSTLFMLTCGEIIDRPRVADAMAKARMRLVNYYRKPR